ncbi:hypothetical protein RIF29_35715 [Crotalaria pallida]|uniref:DDE Tnp4 domain-containing protein n=1 Tax=Crotalaria pallida TaxID=3830 RepID=A0AAN9EBG3_CROPI
MMESRKLAALLSSLISQLLLLLLLLFPPNSPPSSSSSSDNTLPLIHHSLLSSLIATLSPRKRKRKRKRIFFDPSHSPSPATRTPDSFKSFYNMTSSSFEWLSGLLEPLLDCRDPAHLLPLNLPASTRLGIGLHRLANGSDYAQISTRFSVPVSVSKFCVKHLCRVLCTNFRFWVSFPNQTDLQSVSNSFQTLSGLPNCCGAIEASRFQVIGTETSDDQCVAAQVVVDSSCRILNVVAGFNGNKNNSMILKSSTLFKDIEDGMLLNNDDEANLKNQYLVGDSCYPLLPWLMVPFHDAAPGSDEESFNKAHEVMRLSAIRTAASLRNWGILREPIRDEVKMAVAYIGACSILHNGLLMREDFSALASVFEDYQVQQERYREEACRGFEDDLVEGKALVTRSALATIAKTNS